MPYSQQVNTGLQFLFTSSYDKQTVFLALLQRHVLVLFLQPMDGSFEMPSDMVKQWYSSATQVINCTILRNVIVTMAHGARITNRQYVKVTFSDFFPKVELLYLGVHAKKGRGQLGTTYKFRWGEVYKHNRTASA